MIRMQGLFLGVVLACSGTLVQSAEPAAATASATPAEARQHYLTADEMSRMQEFKPAAGKAFQRWMSDRLTAANYRQLIVDPVIYHPVVTPDAQVSQTTLDEIAAFLTSKEKESLGGKLTLVDAASAGTLRLSTAITGVSIKTEGMKPYEVLPAAAVFGLMKNASGNRKQNVQLFIETRMVDAVSGELLSVTMREVQGKDLKGKKDRLELDDVSPALSDALSGALNTFAERGF